MPKTTDKARLDFLDRMTGGYTGKIIFRWSNHARGWRLHETSRKKGVFDNVRDAIDDGISREKEGDYE